MISLKYIVKIIFATLFIFSGLFLVSSQSVNACTVNVGQSGVRVSGGLNTGPVLDEDFFQDDNPPFVYLDLKPQGCGNTDNLYINVFSMRNGPDMNNNGSILDYQLNSSQLQQEGGITVAFKAGETPCSIWADEDDNNAECQIFFVVSTLPLSNPNTEIVLMVGNMIEGLTPQDAESFSSVYGAGMNPVTGGGCTNLTGVGYFYKVAVDAATVSDGLLGFLESYLEASATVTLGLTGYLATQSIDFNGGDICNTNLYAPFSTDIFTFNSTENGIGTQKLHAYYESLGNSFSELAYAQPPQDPSFFDEWFPSFEYPPVAALAFPAIRYQCDGICDENWAPVPNPFLEFGTFHSADDGSSNLSPLPEFYDDEYFPLAPLPFDGLSGGVTPTLGAYLAGLFNALIIITIILSVIMIVIGGIAYMTVDAARNKSENREKIWNAVIGLLISLGSWLLLNTINPELASNLSIQIPTVSLDGYDYIEDGVAVIGNGCPLSKNPDALPPSCPTCTPIDPSITLKSEGNPAPADNNFNTISSSMAPKLVALQTTLAANSINWRVTEAFPPTYRYPDYNPSHCSMCHYEGTCIDANFTAGTSPTVSNIQNFIQAAQSAGLRAVYETNSEAFYQELKAAGIPLSSKGSGNLLWLQNISAPHFSVYN